MGPDTLRACFAYDSEASEYAERHAKAWEADRQRLETAEDGLQQIVNWSNAYPLEVFPEPDFKKAHEVLTAAGMTLDAISASNMRHVVEGVGKIARAALAAREE